MNGNALRDLQPADVFDYFCQLSNVPRGSGNEKAVSDLLVGFAMEHNLDVIRDEAYNVIIKKPGTKGYENSPVVILQGHMDMVCEKTPESIHDFSKDPLHLCIADDEWIYATDTTLGADNGIAVAMGMALMASVDIPHPPIELLITTSEETGMDGAIALNPDNLLGKTLINIDSEEEGTLTVSCAGGCTTHVSIPVSWEESPSGAIALSIDIGGLLGGHSGIEINKGRANANKLLGRILYKIGTRAKLVSVNGGSKHNAIAREAHAVLMADPTEVEYLKNLVCAMEKTLQNEYKTADSDMHIVIKRAEVMPEQVMSERSAAHVIRMLYLIPDGIQSMSINIPGLVESSLNLGIVQTRERNVELCTAIRSCIKSIKQNIYEHVGAISDLLGAEYWVEGEYPEWQYDPDSKLREICIEQYETLFRKKPEVIAIHAGLECALFAKKFNEKMDMISLGPTIVGVHTTQERLSISSTQRTWSYLLAVLKALR